MSGAIVGHLQVSGLAQAPTGLLVALGVLVLAVALLALRGLVDRFLGPEAPTTTYRIVEEADGLALVEAHEATGRRLVGLDDDQLARLMERAEQRNEIRLHAVLTREGDREPWERWRRDPDRAVAEGLELEDSKGSVEVRASGRVRARPPLDDAVRDDLIEVLEAVLRE